jgi:cell division protein FtsN
MKAPGGSSRLDSVLKLLLVAFISLLAFSSGVYFGKNMSETEHQAKALEGTTKTEANEAAKNLDVKPEDALVDEEVAEISDKYVNGKGEATEPDVIVEDGVNSAKEKEPAVAKTEAAKTDTAKTEPLKTEQAKAEPKKPDLTEVQKIAQRVAKNEVVEEKAEVVAAPPKKQKRQPASLPKTVGYDPATQFTVQIASYPTADEAKARSAEMVKKGFPAYPVEASIKGKTWYRVSVGSFKTKQEASDYRSQLMKQANVTAAIVQPLAAASASND